MPPKPRVIDVSLPADVVDDALDQSPVTVLDTDQLKYTQHSYYLLALSILTDEHLMMK